MMSDTHVFVSYTQRDGSVTRKMLNRLYENLDGVCNPFIHAIAPPSRFPQLRVVHQLWRSHILIVIESPMVYKSPWVRLEVLLSMIKMMPVIKLSATDIATWTTNKQPNVGVESLMIAELK